MLISSLILISSNTIKLKRYCPERGTTKMSFWKSSHSVRAIVCQKLISFFLPENSSGFSLLRYFSKLTCCGSEHPSRSIFRTMEVAHGSGKERSTFLFSLTDWTKENYLSVWNLKKPWICNRWISFGITNFLFSLKLFYAFFWMLLKSQTHRYDSHFPALAPQILRPANYFY